MWFISKHLSLKYGSCVINQKVEFPSISLELSLSLSLKQRSQLAIKADTIKKHQEGKRVKENTIQGSGLSSVRKGRKGLTMQKGTVNKGLVWGK